MLLSWDERENWPRIGDKRLRSLTATSAVAEDGTEFVRDGDDWLVRPPRPMLCEQRPYPGAGYHCLLDEHPRGTPHSDLTIAWDDNGNLVNADGSIIGPMRD